MVSSSEFYDYSVFKEPEDAVPLRTGPASWRLTLQALAHWHLLAAGRGSLHLQCWLYTPIPANNFAALAPKKDSTPEAETLDSRTTSEASPQDSGDKSSALETGYIESSVMTPKDSKSPQSLKVISSGNFYHRTLENLFPAVGLVGSVSRMPQIPLVMTWTQQCSSLGGGSYDRACNLHLPMLCPSPSCKEQLSYKGFRLDGGPCMHVAFTSIIKFILAWPPFFMIHT